jgi:hypothetical protein
VEADYKYSVTRSKRGIDFLMDAFNWCCSVATMSKLQPLRDAQIGVAQQMSHLKSIVAADHAYLSYVSNSF